MTRTPFAKILIANRSEIALRIARTARALGYRTVAVHSDIDADAAHLNGCDEAVHIGATAPAGSYLNIPRLIEAARISGADAVHPGYGFLAENAAFAQACREAGLVFIGPSPEAIAAMGDKARAKALMRTAGVPCIPGYDAEAQDEETLARAAADIGFPLMVKASAGGGGRGIRRVERAEDFPRALQSARSEATTAFGDARVILEKAVDAPRHVEVQVFGDRHGSVIHLGERDCSVQRRHQKLVEEAPSPAVDAALREAMGEAAVRAARAIGYEGAGTVEFLLDGEGRFHFMEMNTRLQVEHTVTEEITGLDLVEMQLRVAAGEPLTLAQDDVVFRGHAIQVRLCSEDPHADFLPQGGRMALWRPPSGIRVEHALASGSCVPPDYDSMIAKLIAYGRNREEARRRLVSALEDLVALGPPTNQAFLARCLRHPAVVTGEATTAFIDLNLPALLAEDPARRLRAAFLAPVLLGVAGERRSVETASTAGLLQRHPANWQLLLDGAPCSVEVHAAGPGLAEVSVDGHAESVSVLALDGARVRLRAGTRSFDVWTAYEDGELLFTLDGLAHRVRDCSHASTARGEAAGDGRIRAGMAGRVVAVHAAAGDRVLAGQPVLTLEAMKIEHTLVAPFEGILRELLAERGQQVAMRQVLAEVAASGAP